MTKLLFFVFALMSFTSNFKNKIDLNKEVMQIARSFDGGKYKWKGSGVPGDIVFKGNTILKKSPYGTFCSGFTFYVAFQVLNNSNKLKSYSIEQIKKFQREWYGSTKESAETQCVLAMEHLGLGKRVDHADAKEGDFVQIWRNNKSGHSVIFLKWEKDESNKVIGIHYRSTQSKTNGIGDNYEIIGDGKNEVNLDRVHIGRLL